jgi:single-strand DNA-binding protein
MASLNKVFLMGNLTRDPELRYTPSGASVCTFGLAVNRRFKTKQGDNRDETLFVDVTTWAKQAELCSQYLSKGRPVFVEGRLRLESWTGNDGQKRSKMGVVAQNIQFLGGPGGGAAATEAPAEPGAAEEPPAEPGPTNDEIPF